MVDLSKIKRTTLDIINSQVVDKKHRSYLGMSEIGHHCERYLWYSFRHCFRKYMDKKRERATERSSAEEELMIKRLESAGVAIYDREGEVTMAYGHCKGHYDGIALRVYEAPKTEHIWECKALGGKYFNTYLNNGLKESSEMYYAQVQAYMFNRKLERALFTVANKDQRDKDKPDLYFERVRLDKEYAKGLERKAERIVLFDSPSPKLPHYKPTWYQCKMCDALDICHNGKTVERNCRTCRYLSPTNTGYWTCNFYEDLHICTEQQRLGCQYYELMESLKG